jgi:hypothetical protein
MHLTLIGAVRWMVCALLMMMAVSFAPTVPPVRFFSFFSGDVQV